jgi:hypothetical protein
MTYFLISLTNRCNKQCPYCVVKEWRNKPKQFPDKMAVEDLISFLKKEQQSNDIIELTGGEPTMFPDLELLLDWLRKQGTRVILRTNGLNLGEWRRNYNNLIIVFAKHDSNDSYMSERKKYLLPQDLVLDGIPKHIMQKEQGKPIFVNDEISPLTSHPFDRMFFVTNDGKIRFAPCCKEDMGELLHFADIVAPKRYPVCLRHPPLSLRQRGISIPADLVKHLQMGVCINAGIVHLISFCLNPDLQDLRIDPM